MVMMEMEKQIKVLEMDVMGLKMVMEYQMFLGKEKIMKMLKDLLLFHLLLMYDEISLKMFQVKNLQEH
jgi:hypothetical protein